ncbi:hypothetical protein ACOMHN_061804 [Nucella lapillus]
MLLLSASNQPDVFTQDGLERKPENVAFNKPVTVRNLYRARSDACSTVDGLRSTCFVSGDRAYGHSWMLIDLGYVITVTQISVIYRMRNSSVAPLDTRSMLGIMSVDGEDCDGLLQHTSSQEAENVSVEIRAYCKPALTGRYIRFRKRPITTTTSDWGSVSICEISVWVTHDVALMKYADKSHVSDDGSASDVNDDVMLTVYFQGCLKMINTDSSVLWWRVNMGQLFKVYSIQLKGGLEPMTNFKLLVTQFSNVYDSTNDKELCTHKKGSLFVMRERRYWCHMPLVGRYVLLSMPGPSTLSVCRFKAFGHRWYWIKSGDPCTFHTSQFCQKGSFCENDRFCRVAKDDNCQGQRDLCLHGAQCSVGGQCQCNEKMTDGQTKKCDPKPNVVGGNCTPPKREDEDDPCLDSAAFCRADLRCQCGPGFIAEPSTLQCRQCCVA